jgi:SAM-dependent methyltransferase
MTKPTVPIDVEWHINFDRETSEFDATYIDAIIRLASQKSRHKLIDILDAPCGNGRLHEFLRKHGYRVCGVDVNRELIKQAKKRYPNDANKYFIGDIRNFQLNKKFDVYLSWFTSLGYFEDKDNFEVLKNAARHLRRKGIIIIDVVNGESNMAYMAANPNTIFCKESGEYTIIEHLGLEYVNKVPYQLRDERFYKKNGKNLLFLKKDSVRRLRLYSEEDLRHQLSKAGFRHLYSFPGNSFIKFKKDARRIVIVAVKK